MNECDCRLLRVKDNRRGLLCRHGFEGLGPKIAFDNHRVEADPGRLTVLEETAGLCVRAIELVWRMPQ